MAKKLTARELSFLKVIYPDGTVSIGLTVGFELFMRGYVELAKKDRYRLSRKGIIAVASTVQRPDHQSPAQA